MFKKVGSTYLLLNLDNQWVTGVAFVCFIRKLCFDFELDDMHGIRKNGSLKVPFYNFRFRISRDFLKNWVPKGPRFLKNWVPFGSLKGTF